MPRGTTIRDLLEAQSDRKLHAMLAATRQEIQRLALEQRMIQDVLNDRTRSETAKPKSGPKNRTRGQFNGLSRDELLNHIAAVGRPVKPAEMQKILASKGINKNEAAIRTGMTRLEKDHRLGRSADGWYPLSVNGDGDAAKVEAGVQSSLESGQV